MWIKTQHGEFVNSDNVERIWRSASLVYAGSYTDKRTILYGGTEEQADKLMSDFGKAFASEKHYFDVMKYMEVENDQV